MKHLEINLPEEVKDLDSEKYETLVKVTEEYANMEKYIIFLDWKN